MGVQRGTSLPAAFNSSLKQDKDTWMWQSSFFSSCIVDILSWFVMHICNICHRQCPDYETPVLTPARRTMKMLPVHGVLSCSCPHLLGTKTDWDPGLGTCFTLLAQWIKTKRATPSGKRLLSCHRQGLFSKLFPISLHKFVGSPQGNGRFREVKVLNRFSLCD